MPYIIPSRRLTASRDPETPGELNYAITALCLRYLPDPEMRKPGYGDYNAIIGALECAKLELYRRMVTPYEDRKIEENGDVYPH